MPPGRRLGDSCWTCRLRHKACDFVRPTCGSCQKLGIACDSSPSKPAWMDGGSKQKLMSADINRSIRHAALVRREAHLPPGDHQSIAITANEHPQTLDETAGPAQPSATAPSDSCRAVGMTSPIQEQLGSIMIYLDHVFPFLFPFYQPSLAETGRQWVLGLLYQDETSLHIAASLSAYFFSIASQTDNPGMHNDCKAIVRNRLSEQMDMALRSMQTTVSVIAHAGARSTLLDKVRVMEEITQLLIVEVTVRGDVDWSIHLTPALTLLDEILESQQVDPYQLNFATLLGALPSFTPPATPPYKPLPNSADQSAMIFFVSLLLFIDIVASTALGTPPALQIYHHSLLSPQSDGTCGIRLEAVVGCQNWALVAIGDISALCSWRRLAVQSQTLSMIEMVERAAPIRKALDEGLVSLELSTFSTTQAQSARVARPHSIAYHTAIDYASIVKITQIWAYAAKVYLDVSLSGRQTNSEDTRASVTKALRLLQTIESPAQLQTLSWPIAVAGCLALPSQEQHYRRILQSLGDLDEFGTALHALHVMEGAWSLRDKIDGDSWDFTSAFNISDLPTLLL